MGETVKCRKFVPEEGFPLWDELQLYTLQGYSPPRLRKRLLEAAREFLPYRMYKDGRIYMVDAPYGRYIWHFCVELEQEKIWLFPEFVEGYKFGLDAEPPYRNANPYKHKCRSRWRSWDCGYIFGLYHHRNPDVPRLEV